MFDVFYYHAITRKSISAFGALFNDISVAKKDADGNFEDSRVVPIGYGPSHKFLARLDEQPNLTDGPRVATRLPRMSFDITGIDYDSSSKINSHIEFNPPASTIRTRQRLPQVPYIISFELNAFVKNQDECFQIMEQILPKFQPQHTLSVQWIDNVNVGFDLPIALQSLSIDDEYQLDYQSRRVITLQMTFNAKVRYFGRLQTGRTILDSDVTLVDNIRSGNDNDELLRSSAVPVRRIERETTSAVRAGSRTIDLNSIEGISAGYYYGTLRIVKTEVKESGEKTITLDGKILESLPDGASIVITDQPNLELVVVGGDHYRLRTFHVPTFGEVCLASSALANAPGFTIGETISGSVSSALATLKNQSVRPYSIQKGDKIVVEGSDYAIAGVSSNPAVLTLETPLTSVIMDDEELETDIEVTRHVVSAGSASAGDTLFYVDDASDIRTGDFYVRDNVKNRITLSGRTVALENALTADIDDDSTLAIVREIKLKANGDQQSGATRIQVDSLFTDSSDDPIGTEKTLVVDSADRYFQVGDTLAGLTSTETMVLRRQSYDK